MTDKARFGGYGIELHSDLLSYQEEDIEITKEDFYSLSKKIDLLESETEKYNAAVEQLNQLNCSIESIISSGKVTSGVVILAQNTFNNIASSFDNDYKSISIENFSGDNFEQLRITQEGIFNYLERLKTSAAVKNKRMGLTVLEFITKNSKLFGRALSNITSIENEIKNMRESQNEKIDFSLSGASSYFLVKETTNKPDWHRDAEYSKYVLSHYPATIIEHIEKLTSAIKSAKNNEMLDKAIEDFKHPKDLFESSYLDQTYFGQITPKFNESGDKIIYEKDTTLLNRIKKFYTGEVEAEIGITGREILDICKLCKDIVAAADEANKRIKIGDASVNALEDAISKSPYATSYVKKLGKSYVDALLHPVKDEIERSISVVNRTYSVLHTAIKNSPWKTRMV